MSEATKGRILLVEDEVSVRKVVSTRLASWHYEVITAVDGETGLRLAEETQPDLILLDIVLPGIKGREVCTRLKAHPKTRDIPVIFLTALGLPDHIRAGMDCGAEDYITKPYEAEELKERIMVCLLRHQRPHRTTGG